MGIGVQGPCLEGLGGKNVWRMDRNIWGTVAGRAKIKAGIEGKEAAGLKQWTALKWGWCPHAGLAYSTRATQHSSSKSESEVCDVCGLPHGDHSGA